MALLAHRRLFGRFYFIVLSEMDGKDGHERPLSWTKVRSYAGLVRLVDARSRELGIGMPEVGIFDSPEHQRLRHGWNRDHALVAFLRACCNA